MDSWRDVDEDVENEDNFNAGGKDAIIFLVDATKNMHVKQESGDSPFQMVLKAVHATLRRKIFSSPSDLIALILTGLIF